MGIDVGGRRKGFHATAAKKRAQGSELLPTQLEQ
jgi:hypothetical protein